ncbi:MAG: helix-turn-helix domain-containing protein [Bdellovibrio sp.]
MDSSHLITEVVNYIEANLEESISLEQIATFSGYSSWHLQRIFHQHMGETIGNYIRGRRLSCALDELTNSTVKVIDIAIKYDFGSSEAFTRAFKSFYNRTPSEARRSPTKITPFKKAALHPKQVKYIIEEISLCPRIEEVEMPSLIGYTETLPNPLSGRLEYLQGVANLWLKFSSLYKDLSCVNKSIKIGLINDLTMSNKNHIHDDGVSYSACLPLIQNQIETDDNELKTFEIPKRSYAIFSFRGYHEPTQFMIDYIYSTWLPKSQYDRDQGIEWTMLDHTQQLLNPETSLVEYYLPIKPK